MKTKFLIVTGICLPCMWVIASRAIAVPANACKASIHVPTRVNMGDTRVLPIMVEVKTSDGLPFSGQIDLDVEYGQFLNADGSTSNSPISVQVKEGRVDPIVSLEHNDGVSYPLRIYATTGPISNRRLLGYAEVDIRFPRYIQVRAPALSARADGMEYLVVFANVKDQYEDPMADLKVRVRFISPKGEDLQLSAVTNEKGDARIELPPSTRAGYATCQVLSGTLASQIVELLYTEQQSAMVPLRDAVPQMQAKLHWRSATHTAIAAAPGLRLEVREGASTALLNGNRIPLGTAARLKDGRIEVPVLFLRQVIGLKV